LFNRNLTGALAARKPLSIFRLVLQQAKSMLVCFKMILFYFSQNLFAKLCVIAGTMRLPELDYFTQTTFPYIDTKISALIPGR